MENSISSRGLALVSLDDKDMYIPVFIGDPHTIICTTYCEEVVTKNREFRFVMKEVLDSHIKKLSLVSKIKARIFMRKYNKLDIYNFVHSQGMSAFTPNVKLLNFIMEFVIKFNCFDVLEKCLDIVDHKIFTETANCKINPDIIYTIKFTKDRSKLRFEWVYTESDWAVKLTQK